MNIELSNSPVEQALYAWPRVSLGHLPTPLELMPRLSAVVEGHTLAIKRDDCSGLATGGNKVRQLEYYLGDAIAQGADVVLSTGALQSNYMRTLAASAAKLGLECHIQLESRVKIDNKDYFESGNVLLDRMFGANIHYYNGSGDEFDADRVIRQIAEDLASQGRKPYIVPLAPVEKPRGALGYVSCAAELLSQFDAMNWVPDLVVTGSGSGLTHAGLLTGLRLAGHKVPVLGVCVRREASLQQGRIVETCRKVEAMLDCGEVVSDSDVWVDDRALHPGYGQATEHVLRAIRDVAGNEGILLDPVYSGKTAACMLMAIESGDLASFKNILMLHTGGTPAIFAYKDILMQSEVFNN
jgi:D-cysteine desulfhydrase/L-cysteate sulfo-lyase